MYGFEADADYFRSNAAFTNGTGALSTGDTFAITQSLTTDYLATLRPRLGVAADRSLFYVTGGAAFTRVSYVQTYADTLNSGTGTATGANSLIGWTVGGGWEYAWTDHFTTNIAYLFALSQFFMAWFIAWLYVRKAARFDQMGRSVLEHLDRHKLAAPLGTHKQGGK